MEATPPTLQQFTEACREEFAFLVREHGFAEVAPPPAQYQNPFEVHFARSGWRVVVEGLSYGFCASLTIRDPRGRSGCFGLIVPSDFRSRREGLGRGQLGDIRYASLAFRTFGTEFLAGDTSICEELFCRQEALIERTRQEHRREIELWPYRQAARDALAAFARHDYPEVVRLLSPHTQHLSEIERRKLDYAQRH